MKGRTCTIYAKARYPKPVHSKEGEQTDYTGTYAYRWVDLTPIRFELDGLSTVDRVIETLHSLEKHQGADAVIYEVKMNLDDVSSGTEHRKTQISFRHDIDINLHTYISEDSRVKVEYRSDYSTTDGNLIALLKAAKVQGLRQIALRSVMDVTHTVYDLEDFNV